MAKGLTFDVSAIFYFVDGTEESKLIENISREDVQVLSFEREKPIRKVSLAIQTHEEEA